MLFHFTFICGGLSVLPSVWFDPASKAPEFTTRTVTAAIFFRRPCAVGLVCGSRYSDCNCGRKDRPSTTLLAGFGKTAVPDAETTIGPIGTPSATPTTLMPARWLRPLTVETGAVIVQLPACTGL